MKERVEGMITLISKFVNKIYEIKKYNNKNYLIKELDIHISSYFNFKLQHVTYIGNVLKGRGCTIKITDDIKILNLKTGHN